ncbi:MAG: hypothetical protein ABIH86_01950 [Planctomycetota bacterium]
MRLGSVALLVLVSFAGFAAEDAPPNTGKHITYFEDGKTIQISAWYKRGQLSGQYQENYPNGKPKLKCNYLNGELSGTKREFNEEGKCILSAIYTKNELNGKLERFYPSGKAEIAETYVNGKRHGRSVRYADDGKTILADYLYVNGLLEFPLSADFINTEINRLKQELASSNGGPLETALTELKIYRMLVGVPYNDIRLNDQYNLECSKAAELLEVIGRLDHHPKQPAGMSDENYKLGYAGTSQGNLAMTSKGFSRGPADGVTMWMDDSDASNIDRVGHRRWCINPTMLETGFAVKGNYAVMWSLDHQRKTPPDYDYIPFPARGYMRSDFFQATYAWNISLNPDKYEAPVKDKALPSVYPVDVNFRKSGDALELDYYNVNNDGFGVKYCVIFRPKGVSSTPGTTYLVELNGIKSKTGATSLSYFVEFISSSGATAVSAAPTASSDVATSRPASDDALKFSKTKKPAMPSKDTERAGELRAALIQALTRHIAADRKETAAIGVYGRVKTATLVSADEDVLTVRVDGDLTELDWTDIDATSFKTLLSLFTKAASTDAIRDIAEFYARMDDRDGFDATVAAAQKLSADHLEAVNELLTTE